MAQVVFVEGVSGVGKSTMVKMLSESLINKGYSVKSYLESDYANPIDFYCTAYMSKSIYEELCINYQNQKFALQQNSVELGDVVLVRYYNSDTTLFCEPLLSELRKMEFCYKPTKLVPLEKYSDVYETIWKNFFDNIEDDIDFYIFDGSLLHHPINDMMRNYNITVKEAAKHIKLLISTMENISWSVFYLYSDDIETQLKKAYNDRKQQLPNEQQIAFWKLRYENDKYVLENVVSKFQAFNISDNGWGIARESIMSLLG